MYICMCVCICTCTCHLYRVHTSECDTRRKNRRKIRGKSWKNVYMRMYMFAWLIRAHVACTLHKQVDSRTCTSHIACTLQHKTDYRARARHTRLTCVRYNSSLIIVHMQIAAISRSPARHLRPYFGQPPRQGLHKAQNNREQTQGTLLRVCSPTWFLSFCRTSAQNDFNNFKA